MPLLLLNSIAATAAAFAAMAVSELICQLSVSKCVEGAALRQKTAQPVTVIDAPRSHYLLARLETRAGG